MGYKLALGACQVTLSRQVLQGALCGTAACVTQIHPLLQLAA